LTPDDARDGVARATGSDDLARRARALVARCDAARFDPGAGRADDLLSAGRLFFRDLGPARPEVRREGGKIR
jgi:hypothetical protein